MAKRQMTEKTIVFNFGDLSADQGNAGRLMDDETRELPLISGRFAGRHWNAEELLREKEKKTAEQRKPLVRRHRWIAPVALAGAALSFSLLTGTLLGYAHLTELNDQILTSREEVIILRQEQDVLSSRSASAMGISAESYAAKTLGMQRRAAERADDTASQNEDRATVLGIRRGQGFTHFCRTIIDKVGEYLR